MSKKLKITLYITVILLVVYSISFALKDDVQRITEDVYSLNHHKITIAHIQLLDNNQAIVFYEWGNAHNLYFGSALYRKNLLGWRFVSGSSGSLAHGYKLDWGFSNLIPHFSGYTDLIRGKVLDPEIEEVRIKTHEGNEYKANLIEYNNGEKFWFLITSGEDLVGSTIRGLSSDGKVIEQISK